MTETTARRLTVASLIRELRAVSDDLYRAGGTDDSAHGEMIRLAGDDVRSALGELERAMVVMLADHGRLGRIGPRRSVLGEWMRAAAWVIGGFAALGLLDVLAGKIAGF